jgi:hypothetical protein
MTDNGHYFHPFHGASVFLACKATVALRLIWPGSLCQL